MAAWFGHTQTLTSISKSVTTVAGGIMRLETNLATFMKKVIYYDKFFQRIRANLPQDVMDTATRLFARCYEYRDEIRDELESSLAYVADAGRWVVGMEDWNTKMEKRLLQINELVLLANSLLVEYAIFGRVGAGGSMDELDAYLRTIADSVVLRYTATKDVENKLQKKTMTARNSSLSTTVSPAASITSLKTEDVAAESKSEQHSEMPLQQEALVPLLQVDSTNAAVNESGATPNTSVPSNENTTEECAEDNDEDDDLWNPFAESYKPPMNQLSLESSLASLAGGSVGDSSIHSAYHHGGSSHGGSSEQYSQPLDDISDDDNPDSPVSLSGYECLDMDSIPKYVAFKTSRQQLIKPSTNTSNPSLQWNGMLKRPFSANDRNAHGHGEETLNSTLSMETEDQATSITESSVNRMTSSAHSSTGSVQPSHKHSKRGNPLMDMNYSYDFQREADYNPFVPTPSVVLEDEETFHDSVADDPPSIYDYNEDDDDLDEREMHVVATTAPSTQVNKQDEERVDEHDVYGRAQHSTEMIEDYREQEDEFGKHETQQGSEYARVAATGADDGDDIDKFFAGLVADGMSDIDDDDLDGRV